MQSSLFSLPLEAFDDCYRSVRPKIYFLRDLTVRLLENLDTTEEAPTVIHIAPPLPAIMKVIHIAYVQRLFITGNVAQRTAMFAHNPEVACIRHGMPHLRWMQLRFQKLGSPMHVRVKALSILEVIVHI